MDKHLLTRQIETVRRSLIEFRESDETPKAKPEISQKLAALLDDIEAAITKLSDCDNIDGTRDQEILQASEARNRALIEAIPDAIICLGSDGTQLDVRLPPDFAFPVPKAYAIGKKLDEVLPPKIARQALEKIERAIETGQVQTFEYQIAINDELHTRETRIVAISPDEVIAIIRDITKRKQFEEEKSLLFEAVNLQREKLRALAARLSEVEETERRQLARELHDQVGQNLTALGLNLNIIRSRIATILTEDDPARIRLDESFRLVEEMAERVRDVMANLRPPVLDDYGLVAALRWYGNRFALWTGLTVTTEGKELDPRLAPPLENALFRIVQEALTNVAKHAQATQVTIMVDIENSIVRLTVADDGIGLETTSLSGPPEQKGWGLLSMLERTEAVGGWFRIESSPGQGTQVIVEVVR